MTDEHDGGSVEPAHWEVKAVRGENVAALCDVDANYAAGMFKQYPKARLYNDYRKMLDEEKGIDAVVIGTPDHTHAVIAMAAMNRGKHVYCAKPLTRTVHEAMLLWDGGNMRFTNDDEANKLLSEPYRAAPHLVRPQGASMRPL